MDAQAITHTPPPAESSLSKSTGGIEEGFRYASESGNVI